MLPCQAGKTLHAFLTASQPLWAMLSWEPLSDIILISSPKRRDTHMSCNPWALSWFHLGLLSKAPLLRDSAKLIYHFPWRPSDACARGRQAGLAGEELGVPFRRWAHQYLSVNLLPSNSLLWPAGLTSIYSEAGTCLPSCSAAWSSDVCSRPLRLLCSWNADTFALSLELCACH